MRTNLPGPSGHSTHGNRRWVRVPNEVHMDHLRKRAGRAYLRIEGQVSDIAAALGFKSHSGVSQRRQGRDGPLPGFLAELDRLARAGYDVSPLVEAVIETVIDAQGSADLCLNALSVQEQRFDAEEDAAQIEFHVTGCPRRWYATHLEKFTFAKISLLPALRRHV